MAGQAETILTAARMWHTHRVRQLEASPMAITKAKLVKINILTIMVCPNPRQQHTQQ
jgi:hypothetical protein